MAQTVPIDIRAGISKTGVAFGATIYQLDGTTSFSAFSVAGWYEAPAGTGSWHHAGVSLPDAGGVVAYGVVAGEYNRFAVEQVKATPTNITAGTITTVTNLTNAPTVGDLTATMKASVTTAATAATPAAASVTAPVTVGTNNDKTNYALSSAGVQAIWDALTSALTTVGSIGKLIVTNLDAAISSRMATFSYTAPPTAVQNRQEMDSNSTQLAKLGTPANASVSADIAAVKSDTGAVKAKTDNLPSDPADASDIAASFSSIASTLSTIAGYIDTEVAAILAQTSTTGVVLSTATKQAIADEILKRGMANVDDASPEELSLYHLIAAILNGSMASGVWTAHKSTGATFVASTLTTDAAAVPVTGVST